MSQARDTSTRQQRSFPYELRSFPVRTVDGEVPGDIDHWMKAVSLGFYGNAPTPEIARRLVESQEVDGRVVTGAYLSDTEAPVGAWGVEYPVATYSYHRKTLNIGRGTLLPVHQITAVTVRPSHRRRGLLRAMMSSDLAQAKAAGLPIAALTASEATIYGRFGFGVATHECAIEVSVKGGIVFHNPAAAALGTVEVAEASTILQQHNEVFAQVHASRFGSIGRQDWYRLTASGQGNFESLDAVKNIRAALHYNAAGVVDGYVTYKPVTDPNRSAIEIVDLLAATEDAYLALWNFLGSLDLIDAITWAHAPEVDPLEWAMAAKRDYKRIQQEDLLWLRILDVPAALAARHYEGDGEITLHVGDPLGHASGVFRLMVDGGSATVTRLADTVEAELNLGVAELSSLYLGGVSAQTLLAAGRVQEYVPGTAARLDSLLRPTHSPHCLTHF